MTKQDVINLYQQGKSISEIARTQNMYNYRSIQKILKEAKIPIRGGRKKKSLTPEQLKDIKKLRQEQNISIKELAQLYNLDRETMANLLKDNDIEKKSNNKINCNIKEDYFEVIDEPNKAYILGLLLTDGCVDNSRGNGRIRLALQKQDVEILEKIKKILGVETKLYEDKRGNGMYSLEFSSKKIFEDLQKYSIIPNKTYNTTNLPTNIPNEFIIDFLRGMFDGDGTLTYSDDKSRDVTFRLSSHFESICYDYQILIDKLIGKTEHNKIFCAKDVWNCAWRGYKQVLSILDILYKDADLYLDRKYQKYLELKQRN